MLPHTVGKLCIAKGRRKTEKIHGPCQTTEKAMTGISIMFGAHWKYTEISGKETERTRNLRKNRKPPELKTAEIGINREKGPGSWGELLSEGLFWRLPVSQNHQAVLIARSHLIFSHHLSLGKSSWRHPVATKS